LVKQIKYTLWGFVLLINHLALAQQGDNTYQFLQLPNSARTAGLGGINISLDDNDLSLSYHNPALLSDTLDKTVTFNYINYMTDINYGYSAFAKDFDHLGTFAAGLFYLDYGDFVETDIYGNTVGSFVVKEYALNLMWSRRINPQLRLGANLKPVYSVMESYTSYGIALDLGLQYMNANELFRAGFAIKNMGYQIKTYTSNNQEDLPFEILLGFSQKLAHAPFRASATYRHIQQFDIGYDVEDSSSSTAEVSSPNFAQLFMRHWVFGLEFIPSDNFYLMLGYNTQRRSELSIEGNGGLVGYSWGAGLKISKFNISYSSARYHLAGRTNFFSISTNLNRFM